MTSQQIASTALKLADQLDRLHDQMATLHNAVNDMRESNDASRMWQNMDIWADDACSDVVNAERRMRAIVNALSK